MDTIIAFLSDKKSKLEQEHARLSSRVAKLRADADYYDRECADLMSEIKVAKTWLDNITNLAHGLEVNKSESPIQSYVKQDNRPPIRSLVFEWLKQTTVAFNSYDVVNGVQRMDPNAKRNSIQAELWNQCNRVASPTVEKIGDNLYKSLIAEIPDTAKVEYSHGINRNGATPALAGASITNMRALFSEGNEA